jgi:glycosyltransferase involved in cell wall biosynthesis
LSRRVALVHEWLTTWGGSESVLASLVRVYGGAPLFTLLARPDERTRSTFGHLDVRTTWLDRVPGIRHGYRFALPFMPHAWRTHDLAGYDVVLTSSHSMAKSVRVPDGLHVCYCHSPPRYLWDLNEEYRAGSAALLRGSILERLRREDLRGATGVDHFVANSRFVAGRIDRIYGRPADVVYPPVDVDGFTPEPGAGTHYLAGGRLVAYKRIDRVVEAANRARLPLVVFGDGPERRRLEALAGPSVRLVGAVGNGELRALLRDCRAFVFPGIEDFGILPVEAQAAGRPVVALAEGGATETVLHGATGLLYEEDSLEGLVDALVRADRRDWDPAACARNARRFSRERFEREIGGLVDQLSAGQEGSR